ncbi:hypothetical protein Kpol_1044p24 [Vanderwaltozyma polyspora DSM 70294]|uniref:ubiquitinyl hydrolase 1 n=1 Tax=Vanderwaltozyma polyspora (strain ATCC 22028 / DSM 70294 / BCRC 21397 / CBS 2163 / NBRC 10782 / NRRL Y-8283 / UCD 57-17) TaxID=436907 RepID=A7TP54_VANPO|nr:uncharacterized protein Kpol_1044p24 [Vanderwaltozyma polyspora DSM 70294]EDO15964.1 hypothetical protein Kpol_1044p24 [Vanderwaltozyma polyspora DSM 70294]
MTTPETLKPLVDRVLSNPLQFRPASNKKLGSNSNDDTSNYIVIGGTKKLKTDDKLNQPIDLGSKAGVSSQISKVKKNLPKSMAEAISMYTSIENSNSDKDQDLSDNDFNIEESSDSSNDVFHEAKEYIESEKSSDEKQLETVDEDLGMPLDEEASSETSTSPSSSSADEDFKIEENETVDAEEDDEEDDDDYNEDEQEDDIVVSDSERAQLQEEAKEFAEQEGGDEQDDIEEDNDDDDDEELKHKEPSRSSSEQKLTLQVKEQKITLQPPVDVAELSQFYIFNENVNDAGSIISSPIVKNWGPVLTNLKPCGLLNHGVTCYTNAAVQAMLHIPAIQHYLFDVLRGSHKNTIKADSVTQVLAETSKKMWWRDKKHNKSTYINPKKLISRLDDINCMMSEWQQEDSHEYFMSLMSRLQEDSVPKGRKMTESIVYDVFGGMLKQIVTCKSCGSVSKTEQPIYDLSLHLKGKRKQTIDGDSSVPPSPIQQNQNNGKFTNQNQGPTHSGNEENEKNKFTIEKAIRDFFNPELIKVDKEKGGYVCEKCHKTTNAIKCNSILRAPETLLVHLKKFRFNGQSSSKMKQAVAYPMFLDLTEYCEDPEKGEKLPVKYQLISVVVHEGRSLSSGHYIAHCRQPDGSWAIYDDEYINKISERNVLKEPNAYYLIYTRLTPKEVPLRNPPISNKDIGVPSQNIPSTSNNSSPRVNKTTTIVKNQIKIKREDLTNIKH